MGVWHGLADRVRSWGGTDRAVENARQACVQLSQRRLEREDVRLFLEQEGVLVRSA